LLALVLVVAVMRVVAVGLVVIVQHQGFRLHRVPPSL
jgi:hypothetical protein